MTLDLKKMWSAEFEEHKAVLQDTFTQLQAAFDRLLQAAASSVRGGGKIFFFGNGGSAADAQHLATELTVRFIKDRAPIAAIALTTDTSALTAIGNDFGFDHLFARQIAALGRKGDIAIAISTSGNSPNVLNAVTECKNLGITVAGFTGRSGGKMAGSSDILFNVPSTTTARIQEMHMLIGHMFCGALEIELGLIAAEPAARSA
jgi:D-sedoheptulose 7-phosphate isomerase